MRRPSSRTRLFTASIAAVATLALVACGDDDDDDTSATTETVDTAETTESTETTETAATTDTTDIADTTETSGDTTASSAGGEVGSREDYVEAATAGFPVEDEDLGACIAEALISDDVFAQIDELGVTPQQFEDEGPEGTGITLDEEQASAMAEDVAACGDLAAAVLDDEDAEACAADNMSNEQLAQYVTFNLFSVDTPDDLQAAYDAMDECMSETATTTS